MNISDYKIKKQDYFLNVRTDIISLIPKNSKQKVLEIGAGSGNTLVYIKENGLAQEVMGIELIHIPESNQQNEIIDKFQIGNIENEDLNAEPEYFDIIICGDVLEHLIDPWNAVKKISRYLKEGGLLIVSMPNIREWKTILKILLKGDFKYQVEGGIMDKTHLRFFCKKNIIDLLSTDSLKPIYITPNFKMEVIPNVKKRRIFNYLTFGLFEDFLTVQYLVKAKKYK